MDLATPTWQDSNHYRHGKTNLTINRMQQRTNTEMCRKHLTWWIKREIAMMKEDLMKTKTEDMLQVTDMGNPIEENPKKG